MCINKSQQGVSLIEVLLFIVIIGIALASVLSVLNIANRNSVDPLMRKQALAIAESLLEEVELQDFSNPSGGFSGAATQANRTLFDDIFDYNGFSTSGIYPADGTATIITGLDNYSVNVSVANSAAAWGTVPATAVAEITVTVTDPNGQSLSAVGYRVDY